MTLKLTSLKLTNFRRFAKLHVDFHPNLTVLIAPNGGGKTAVLDAIALVLHQHVGRGDADIPAFHRLRERDHRVVPASETRPNVIKAEGDVRVQVAASVSNPGSDAHRVFSIDASLSGTVYSGLVEGRNPTNPSHAKAGEDIPVAAYYGVDRRFKSDALARESTEVAGARHEGYRGSLDSAANYQRFLDRFAQWYRITSDAKIRAMETGAEYEPGEFDRYMAAVRQAVDTCLAGTGWGSLNFSVTLQSLTVVHETMGEQQVGMLSEGVRSVLAMAADIAHRCVVLNPHRGAEACSSPGVVLIDELDLHLHPEWQQRIIESLRTAFPNIQFIVTTHSPQVLTTVTASQIRVLPDIGTDTERADEPDFNPLAHSAGDALSRVMGVAAKPTTGDMGQIALNLELYKYELRRGRSDSERARQAKEALDALGYELERADLAMWKALGAVSEPSEVPTSDADSAAGEGPAADA